MRFFLAEISACGRNRFCWSGIWIFAPRYLRFRIMASGVQASQAFLDAVKPEHAIFSCRPYAGSDISADVLSRYRDRTVQALRTDLHGAIQITSNGTQLKTYTFMPYRDFRP